MDQEGLLLRQHERVVLLDVGEALHARHIDLLPRQRFYNKQIKNGEINS
jgi:hypothetical protein